MRIPGFILIVALSAGGLCACVPDMVTIEAVPTPKFSRDLAQCQAAEAGNLWPDAVKRCMKAKGYRFLRQY
jgi:hypothetical protein